MKQKKVLSQVKVSYFSFFAKLPYKVHNHHKSAKTKTEMCEFSSINVSAGIFHCINGSVIARIFWVLGDIGVEIASFGNIKYIS